MKGSTWDYFGFGAQQIWVCHLELDPNGNHPY